MWRLLLVFLLVACSRGERAAAPDALGPAVGSDARRIVTLAPSLTDLVLALGAKDRLVGVTRFDDAPEVADLPRVGGYNDPSAEAILRLEPDLLLAQPSPGNKGVVRLLAQEGVSVQVFALETIEDVLEAVERLGGVLGVEERAKALADELRTARERARTQAQARTREVKATILYGVDPLIAAGPGSFPHQILEDAGAVNVVESSTQPFPRLSVERLMVQQPDLLLLAGFDAHGASAESLPAGLGARVVHLRSSGFLRPGPGIVEALDELATLFATLESESQPAATR